MKRLGFIGGGNMAEALVHGLLSIKLFKPLDLVVADPEPKRRRRLARIFGVDVTKDNGEAVRDSDALLIAVKPQMIEPVLGELAGAIAAAPVRLPLQRQRRPIARIGKTKLFISIVAGVTVERLENGLGRYSRVIRVMPNAPAMVGLGMAALVRGTHATRADQAFAMWIFRAVGEAVALDNESQLDAVTALSGSGPAYVYLFAKALAEAGAAEGLPIDLALKMTLQTIKGAEESIRRLGLGLTELIQRVASPGGTTEAALNRFDEDRFSAIVSHAVHAAADRSRELGRVI
ncbi:MAG: pyrroline-5-carboxylate reductase [Candidatus Binataceae bacterium]